MGSHLLFAIILILSFVASSLWEEGEFTCKHLLFSFAVGLVFIAIGFLFVLFFGAKTGLLDILLLKDAGVDYILIISGYFFILSFCWVFILQKLRQIT